MALPGSAAALLEKVRDATVQASGPLLLNEAEAARVSGLPVRNLRRRRSLGLPPEYLKAGRRVYYRPAALRAFVDSLPKGGAGIPARLFNGVRAERTAPSRAADE
jgi:hypothetical protein